MEGTCPRRQLFSQNPLLSCRKLNLITEKKKRGECSLVSRASVTWVTNFKRRNRIVSRKITKSVTTLALQNRAKLVKSASDFVEWAAWRASWQGPYCLNNTNQSRIDLEMHSGRSLDIKGAKHVQK